MHTIRLGGPWQLEFNSPRVQHEVADCHSSLRVKLPFMVDADQFSNPNLNSVRFKRAFSTPTGLAENQDVLVWIENTIAPARIFVNGELAGTISTDHSSRSFSIVALLFANKTGKKNLLEIEVDVSELDSKRPVGQPEPALLGNVELRIPGS